MERSEKAIQCSLTAPDACCSRCGHHSDHHRVRGRQGQLVDAPHGLADESMWLEAQTLAGKTVPAVNGGQAHVRG